MASYPELKFSRWEKSKDKQGQGTEEHDEMG